MCTVLTILNFDTVCKWRWGCLMMIPPFCSPKMSVTKHIPVFVELCVILTVTRNANHLATPHHIEIQSTSPAGKMDVVEKTLITTIINELSIKLHNGNNPYYADSYSSYRPF